jgi:hypothetical protein
MAVRLVLLDCMAHIRAQGAGHGARRRARETGRIWQKEEEEEILLEEAPN